MQIRRISRVTEKELARPLRPAGMERYLAAFKYRGKVRSVWNVGGVAATNAAVRHALDPEPPFSFRKSRRS
jgi:hypothetical protein